MNKEDLNEIQDCLDKISPGPWRWNDDGLIYSDDNCVIAEDNKMNFIMRPDNARFIANAPTYIQQLLDEVKQEREKNEQLEKKLSLINMDSIVRDCSTCLYKFQYPLTGHCLSCNRKGIIHNIPNGTVDCWRWRGNPILTRKED